MSFWDRIWFFKKKNKREEPTPVLKREPTTPRIFRETVPAKPGKFSPKEHEIDDPLGLTSLNILNPLNPLSPNYVGNSLPSYDVEKDTASSSSGEHRWSSDDSVPAPSDPSPTESPSSPDSGSSSTD